MELDDFLNSIGLPSSETSSEEPQVRVIAPDPEPITLSNEDYDNILSDIGFEGPPDADAEEVTEEEGESEEVVENTEESRDLDAEEDADWQEAIDSGRISSVFTQAFEEGIVN